MRYSVIFWDSGGTIFSSEKDLKGLNNIPTPGVVASKRVFRVELAMKMFGHTPPPNLSSLIGDLSKELSKQDGA